MLGWLGFWREIRRAWLPSFFLKEKEGTLGREREGVGGGSPAGAGAAQAATGLFLTELFSIYSVY